MIEQEEKSTVVMNAAMYYMLPMLQLNESSFGVGFVNSYVDKSGYIIVDVNSPNFEPKISQHSQYVTDFNIEFNTFPDNVREGCRIVFAIPDEFLDDIKLFEQGKYSELSAHLKVAIGKYSNLNKSDVIIQSLNPQIKDREKIADSLGVKVELIKELLSAPSSSNFIKIK